MNIRQRISYHGEKQTHNAVSLVKPDNKPGARLTIPFDCKSIVPLQKPRAHSALESTSTPENT